MFKPLALFVILSSFTQYTINTYKPIQNSKSEVLYRLAHQFETTVTADDIIYGLDCMMLFGFSLLLYYIQYTVIKQLFKPTYTHKNEPVDTISTNSDEDSSYDSDSSLELQ